MIKTGGGTFDPDYGHVYFTAANMDRLRHAGNVHSHILVAINELNAGDDLNDLVQWCEQGKRVFMDSGVYALATGYAKQHDVTMDVALSTPPGEMDGFETLYEKYVNIVHQLEPHLWGYVEIDQGGQENKIKTRARLEAEGLKPIPVYHPLNDGWDYFDYLAERYDRICFGNIVQADPPTRKRLIATMWERHCKYPKLWIHILGLTPSEMLNAYPANSTDSSSWLSAIRWSGYQEYAMSDRLGELPTNFQYKLGSDPDSPEGSRYATKVSAYGAGMMERNWNNYINALNEHGIEVYPNDH